VDGWEDRSDASGGSRVGLRGGSAPLKMMNYEQCLEHSLRTFKHNHPKTVFVHTRTHQSLKPIL